MKTIPAWWFSRSTGVTAATPCAAVVASRVYENPCTGCCCRRCLHACMSRGQRVVMMLSHHLTAYFLEISPVVTNQATKRVSMEENKLIRAPQYQCPLSKGTVLTTCDTPSLTTCDDSCEAIKSSSGVPGGAASHPALCNRHTNWMDVMGLDSYAPTLRDIRGTDPPHCQGAPGSAVPTVAVQMHIIIRGAAAEKALLGRGFMAAARSVQDVAMGCFCLVWFVPSIIFFVPTRQADSYVPRTF